MEKQNKQKRPRIPAKAKIVASSNHSKNLDLKQRREQP
jgi:hypothetical protein